MLNLSIHRWKFLYSHTAIKKKNRIRSDWNLKIFYYCARLFNISKFGARMKLVEYCASIDREIVKIQLEFYVFFFFFFENFTIKGTVFNSLLESSKKRNLSAKKDRIDVSARLSRCTFAADSHFIIRKFSTSSKSCWYLGKKKLTSSTVKTD